MDIYWFINYAMDTYYIIYLYKGLTTQKGIFHTAVCSVEVYEIINM